MNQKLSYAYRFLAPVVKLKPFGISTNVDVKKLHMI